jgi:cysteine-rich repeat protein
MVLGLSLRFSLLMSLQTMVMGLALACPEGEVGDCHGTCAPTTWLGDGICDDGTFEFQGAFVDLACAEHALDGGDCGAGDGCAAGEVEDCMGACAPAAWLGDGWCDDGWAWYLDSPVVFDCMEQGFDGGDCGDVPGCAADEVVGDGGDCAPGLTWTFDRHDESVAGWLLAGQSATGWIEVVEHAEFVARTSTPEGGCDLDITLSVLRILEDGGLEEVASETEVGWRCSELSLTLAPGVYHLEVFAWTDGEFALDVSNWLERPQDFTVGPCGDGILDGAEACDDGNDDDTDACTASCELTMLHP